MPQLALSAASFTASAAPAVAATAAKVGFMTTLKSVALNALMNVAITAAMSALQPQVGAAGRTNEWLLSPDGPIPFAAGRVGVAGSAVHIDTFGPDLMYKGFVTVLSGAGPIDGFESFRGDDEFVIFDVSGKAITSQWKGEMWLKRSLGAQRDVALSSPLGLKNNAFLPGWGAASRLSGKACDMLILGENSKGSAYPTGEVKPLRVFRGLRVWDPRLDSTYPGGAGPCRLSDPSTWVYSANPGLWAIKWSLGLWEGPIGKGAPQLDRQVGGIGAKASGIEFETLVALANIADANGWSCAAYPTTDDDKSQVLDAFLQAAGAIYAQRAGKISCIQRAAPRTSIVTISAADTAGPLEIDTAASRIDRINTIRPRFWSEQHRWQLTALPEVTAAAYREQDGGTRPRGIDFPFVTNAKQAAQLAALQIANTREGIAGVIPLKPHLQRIRPGDAFTITEPGFVLDGVKCLCLNTDYDPATGIVRVSFVSETDAKYAFAMGQSPVVPVPPVLEPVDPTHVSPPLPEDWTIVVRPPAPDGTQVPGFDLTGIVSNDTATAIIVEWGLPPDPPPPDPIPEAPEGERQPVWADWVNWTQAYQGPPTVTNIPIEGLQPDQTYYVAIQYQRGQNFSERGVWGPYTAPNLIAGDTTHVGGVPVGDIPGLDTEPPATPAPPTLSSTTTIANGEPASAIAATWTANTEDDLNGYEVEVTNLGFTVVDYVATNAWRRDAVIGQSYGIRVRALDKAGNRSDWTEAQSITASGDTTAPEAPTAFSATAVPGGTIFLEWTNPSAVDLRRVVIYENTTNSTATATRVGEASATASAKGSYTRAGLTAGDARFFWLKAEDTSGNLSIFSAATSATVPGIGGGDLDTTPPAVPTGLSLSSSVSAGSGDPVVRLIATWVAVTDTDLSGYEVEWKEGAGNPVVRVAGSNRDEIVRAIPGTVYQARVRAYDGVGNKSAWTGWASVTAASDNAAPGAPISLLATNSLGSIFLRWTNVPDADLREVEVFESATNDSASAAKLATVNALPGQPGGYARSGLATGSTRYYWLKSVDSSGNRSAFSTVISRTLSGVGNEDVAVGTLTGDRLVAGSVEGTVLKTTTSLPGTITVGGTGVEIATIESRASDPAARVNANTTRINPGNIAVSGSTTLADWRSGSDTTKIEGGALATNSVRAGSLEIGNRGVTFDRFSFSTSGNTLTWGNGRVTYVDDLGATVPSDVSGGSATWTGAGDCLYIYWLKGALALSTTYSPAVARSANTVIIGAYYGGTNFTANYGRTMIDGAYIKTDTVDTVHLKALSVKTGILDADAVTANKLAADAVWARNIRAEQVTMDKLSVTGALPVGLTFGPGGATIGQMNTTYQTVLAMQSDAVLSRGEKPALVRQYAEMSQEYLSLTSMAASLAISSTGFTAAFNAVGTYLSGLTPPWSDSSQDTAIDPVVFNAKFNDYATAREDLSRRAAIVDPAGRINGGSTTILPGKIAVGGSTLASWQYGGDLTLINGGAVAANSLKANTAEIGNRGVSFDRFSFSTSGNTLTWGNGRVTYIADSGTATAFDISGGSYAYSASGGDVTYLYWTQGSTTLSTTKSATVATTNAVLIGAYYGSNNFTATYGRTMIDGDFVKTGTLTAIHMNVTNLAAISANLGDINAGNLNFSQGGRRVRMSAGFGTGGDLLLWAGPTSVGQGAETLENGILGISATDGFFGGTTLSGFFSTTASATPIVLGTGWTNVASFERPTRQGWFAMFSGLDVRGTGQWLVPKEPEWPAAPEPRVDVRAVSTDTSGGDVIELATSQVTGSLVNTAWVNSVWAAHRIASNARSGRRRLVLQARRSADTAIERTTYAEARNGMMQAYYMLGSAPGTGNVPPTPPAGQQLVGVTEDPSTYLTVPI